MKTIIVGADSEPARVARAILHSVMIGERMELQAITSEAKSRAVTALIVANIELAPKAYSCPACQAGSTWSCRGAK